MRAIIYQHEEAEDLARLAPALKEAGFAVTKRFRTVQHDDVDADLVVALGGSMSAFEFDLHPFLRDEQALLIERLAGDRPCLGLCLGAQLLAAAAGAEVFAGKNGFEAGAAPVRWTKEALADPVVGGVNPRTVVAHWHRDTFKAVPGATLLASTDRYTQQAFRLGRSFGFQFHPELGAGDFGQWLGRGAEALALEGKDVAALTAQLPKLKAAEAELSGLLARLANHFARCAGQ
jgi:GMP synthase (glutamine-hydrolysing)